MSKDIFENLVTDITAEVLQQVQEQIGTVVTAAVVNRLDELISGDYIDRMVNTRIEQQLHNFTPNVSHLDERLETVARDTAEQMIATANGLVKTMVNERIASYDLGGMIVEQVNLKLDPNNAHYPFPDASIDSAALDLKDLVITGDHVVGGVIKNFGSTGIDDQATDCRVTILDQGTIFENTLYAPRVEVKGGAIIDGDLDIQGRIVDGPAYQQLISDAAGAAKAVITDDVLTAHQDKIFERILTEGLDLGKISLNGRVIVDGQRLLNVFHSQLQSVGILQDLQTSGETLLSETVYASNKRVGVNTMSPNAALSVWDEEVEINIGKLRQDTAEISAERGTLVLSSNQQQNLTIEADGSVTVKTIKIGNLTFTSAATPPNYDAVRGMIVFNENPNLGGPLGWVSLGDARWANFGIID